jgi:hypothetical protein
VTDLDDLTALVPPPAEPTPPRAGGAALPEDHRRLLDRYGVGNLAGLRLLDPADIPQEAERQRWAVGQFESPYRPEDLLPWGIDESGNVIWWLTTRTPWIVVANEARGEEWHRHEGGAVSFLVAILSGRETSPFLSIEGDDFEPSDAT